MVDLGEGLAEGTVVDLVGKDMEEMEGSWPPRECLLPLRCRREDMSVGERERKVYHVCVCVCACVGGGNRVQSVLPLTAAMIFSNCNCVRYNTMCGACDCV